MKTRAVLLKGCLTFTGVLLGIPAVLVALLALYLLALGNISFLDCSCSAADVGLVLLAVAAIPGVLALASIGFARRLADDMIVPDEPAPAPRGAGGHAHPGADDQLPAENEDRSIR
jgi:hypothetical protein